MNWNIYKVVKMPVRWDAVILMPFLHFLIVEMQY